MVEGRAGEERGGEGMRGGFLTIKERRGEERRGRVVLGEYNGIDGLDGFSNLSLT